MIKFGIVMATFCRSNGNSPKYLERSLNSILNQVYKNWDLIIVSDKYEPIEELCTIVDNFKKECSNNIITLYNDKPERDYIKDKQKLWCCAGARSMNIGLKYCRENGYKYYAHLDDDDFWTDTHLEKLSFAYTIYPHCIFANTQSTYFNITLPKEEENIFYISPNNRLPLSCATIHSSFSFRCDIVPFEYFTSFNEDCSFWYSDAIMLNHIKEYLEQNKEYCSIYMPFLTCYHDFEGETLK